MVLYRVKFQADNDLSELSLLACETGITASSGEHYVEQKSVSS